MKLTDLGWIIVVFLLLNSCNKKTSNSAALHSFSSQQEALVWLDSAKYGMFVHWGVYAVPAGEWQGMQVPGISEWIMNTAEIPVEAYEKLAQQFNPTEFDAEEWVRAIKAAGMQYIVITAKHHDGFAMFDSPSSEYDIVDATPYGKDPIKQLADACHRNGIRLGFYYSHDQDWHHPDGSGNDWDYKPEEKYLQKYLDEKVKPQVRELLTQYGPIAIIWFDTPKTISAEQSRELVELVRELQPNCLINDRVGHEMGDYQGYGDNQVPGGVTPGVWETVGTTNHSWGYKKADQDWKSPELMIKLLTNIVSKGGVYLLNVGPDANGNLPQPAVDSLEAVGEWLQTNGEAIYGAGPSPFIKEFDWGAITTKPGKMFIHFYDWPEDGNFRLKGFNSAVGKSYFLAKPEHMISSNVNDGILSLGLPAQKPKDIQHIPVVVVELPEPPQVENNLTNDLDGVINLTAYLADLHTSDSSNLRVEGGGITFGYFDTADQMSWEFQVEKPGSYDIIFYTAVGHWSGWLEGMEVSLYFEDEKFTRKLEDVGRLQNLSTLTWQDAPMKFASVNIEEPGNYSLRLVPEEINPFRNQGLRVRRIKLVPSEMNYMQTLAEKFVEPIYPTKDANDEFLETLKKLENDAEAN